MKQISCTRCGSNELTVQGSTATCDYCQTKYETESDEPLAGSTTIGVESDVAALLQKCKVDPYNRRRYASLILDIDPTNQEALKFLS
jgi:hypothetical protein